MSSYASGILAEKLFISDKWWFWEVSFLFSEGISEKVTLNLWSSSPFFFTDSQVWSAL